MLFKKLKSIETTYKNATWATELNQNINSVYEVLSKDLSNNRDVLGVDTSQKRSLFVQLYYTEIFAEKISVLDTFVKCVRLCSLEVQRKDINGIPSENMLIITLGVNVKKDSRLNQNIRLKQRK